MCYNIIKRLIEYLYFRYVLPDIAGEYMDGEQINAIFAKYSGENDLRNLLRSLAREDKNRYFDAQASQQPIIKGEYNRTVLLYRRLEQEEDFRALDEKVSKSRLMKLGGKFLDKEED